MKPSSGTWRRNATPSWLERNARQSFGPSTSRCRSRVALDGVRLVVGGREFNHARRRGRAPRLLGAGYWGPRSRPSTGRCDLSDYRGEVTFDSRRFEADHAIAGAHPPTISTCVSPVRSVSTLACVAAPLRGRRKRASIEAGLILSGRTRRCVSDDPRGKAPFLGCRTRSSEAKDRGDPRRPPRDRASPAGPHVRRAAFGGESLTSSAPKSRW